MVTNHEPEAACVYIISSTAAVRWLAAAAAAAAADLYQNNTCNFENALHPIITCTCLIFIYLHEYCMDTKYVIIKVHNIIYNSGKLMEKNLHS